MKKVLVAAVLIGAISLTGFSLVNAHGRYGSGPGQGYGACEDCGYCTSRSNNEQDREKIAAFAAETKELRKQLAVKRSERRALMHQDNPDENKVAQLTGEIYDLKDLMAEKAKETFGDSLPPFGLMRARGEFGNCGGRGQRNF